MLWIRHMTRLPCSLAQVHPIYECPTPIVTMALKSQFLPQLLIEHLRRQRQHIQIRIYSGPVSGLYSKNTVIADEVSIANYTFNAVTNVSGLGWLYSQEKFDEICGKACCSTSLFHFRNRVRTPVVNLVDAGAEPVFTFTLENQANEKLTIGGVNNARNTGGFAKTSWVNQALLVLEQLASRQAKWGVIDTMLLKSNLKGRAEFSHHTPHFIRDDESGSRSSRVHWGQRFRGRSD